MNETAYKELQAKWLLKSKTIIGVLTTAVAFAAPFLGRLVGFDMAAWVQPVGMALGLILVIIARLKDGGKLTLSWAKAAEIVRLAMEAGEQIADSAKTAAKVTALLLLPSLLLTASPAWAAEPSGAVGLFSLSMVPLLINLFWAFVAVFLGVIFWKILDRWLILPGVVTFTLIERGNVAAGIFAGCFFLGLCVLIGLVIG